MARSRRLNPGAVISKTGISVESIYCRKCMKIKKPVDFFKSTDTALDSNGFMSVCKDCIDDLYDRFYREEGSMERSLLRVCRMINVQFNEKAIESTKQHIDTLSINGKTTDKVFGFYKLSLSTNQKGAIGDRNVEADLTFIEPTRETLENTLKDIGAPKDIRDFWGPTYSWEDLQALEKKKESWHSSHKIDSQAGRILIKFLCLKELDIEKAIIAGEPIDKLVQDLQKLMDTSALSPKYAKAADTGENIDTFGKWIEDIEKTEPAEWLTGEGHEMYRDVADVEGYFQKYFVRPLRNLMLQSPDFNIPEENSDETNLFENLSGEENNAKTIETSE